jgi:hydrogenase-4 membrane subunit HyfE
MLLWDSLVYDFSEVKISLTLLRCAKKIKFLYFSLTLIFLKSLYMIVNKETLFSNVINILSNNSVAVVALLLPR